MWDNLDFIRPVVWRVMKGIHRTEAMLSKNLQYLHKVLLLETHADLGYAKYF